MTMIRRVGVGLTIFVAVLVALCLWRDNPLAFGLPKDSELVALFRANREAFERLRTMAMEDSGSVFYLSEDTLKQSPLSEARRDEYARLMAFYPKLTLGLGSHQVTFGFARGGVGLAIGQSWIKGITYLPDGYEKGCVMTKSLDDLGMRVSDGVYLVPIERNWYLIYSKLD
jgi:hypothetical protein